MENAMVGEDDNKDARRRGRERWDGIRRVSPLSRYLYGACMTLRCVSGVAIVEDEKEIRNQDVYVG